MQNLENQLMINRLSNNVNYIIIIFIHNLKCIYTLFQNKQWNKLNFRILWNKTSEYDKSRKNKKSFKKYLRKKHNANEILAS